MDYLEPLRRYTTMAVVAGLAVICALAALFWTGWMLIPFAVFAGRTWLGQGSQRLHY